MAWLLFPVLVIFKPCQLLLSKRCREIATQWSMGMVHNIITSGGHSLRGEVRLDRELPAKLGEIALPVVLPPHAIEPMSAFTVLVARPELLHNIGDFSQVAPVLCALLIPPLNSSLTLLNFIANPSRVIA